ncbi:MAG: FlgD immunoglobulin-like domain containing protein, partial [Candidatus Eisenbacteria bacterium]
ASSVSGGVGAVEDLASAVSLGSCELTGNTAPAGGAVHVGSFGNLHCRDSVFDDNRSDRGGAIDALGGATSIARCTFVANESANGAHIYKDDEAQLTVDASILATGDGAALSFSPPVFDPPAIGCTDIWGNTGGDWTSPIADQLGVDGNISADPLFCVPTNADYTLASASPCLEENQSSGCPTMGAFPDAGCDVPASAPSEGSEDAVVALDLSAVPNPLPGETTLRFRLPEPSAVEVAIFDVAGKRVRTLVDVSEMAAGEHALVWDGSDEVGSRAPVGVYWCRLMAGSRSVAQRLVLISQ